VRPRGFYAVFRDGRVALICAGYEEAQRASPHRAYKRFATRLEAEEFAAWWNHEHAQPWHR